MREREPQGAYINFRLVFRNTKIKLRNTKIKVGILESEEAGTRKIEVPER